MSEMHENHRKLRLALEGKSDFGGNSEQAFDVSDIRKWYKGTDEQRTYYREYRRKRRDARLDPMNDRGGRKTFKL